MKKGNKCKLYIVLKVMIIDTGFQKSHVGLQWLKRYIKDNNIDKRN